MTHRRTGGDIPVRVQHSVGSMFPSAALNKNAGLALAPSLAAISGHRTALVVRRAPAGLEYPNVSSRPPGDGQRIYQVLRMSFPQGNCMYAVRWISFIWSWSRLKAWCFHRILSDTRS